LYRSAEIGQFVVLGLGSKLASFDVKTENPENAEKGNAPNKKMSRFTTSSILEISDMPDQWMGYDACDVVVIGTSGKDFIPALFGEAGDKNPATRMKREALLEWVRRGGKLIISMGSNSGQLAQYKSLQDLLPLPISIDGDGPKSDYSALTIPGPQSSVGRDGVLRVRGGTVPVANFKIVKDRPYRVVMETNYQNVESNKTVPIIVQSTLGLGRISAVAFDLDRSPFNDYADRSNVWLWLMKECGSSKAASGGDRAKQNSYNSGREEDDFATALHNDLDRFEGVPVISFGWVALFVLLYTLVIGPLEYIILKKVFKKLELTWFTFPLIVLTVSLISYFSAYAIKGSDLKLNKFDVIDVDCQGNRIYGRTWLSIFSPRQESFSFNVSPNAGWASERADAQHSTLTDWVHGSRGGSQQSIFRNTYTYHLNLDPNTPRFADGLESVPIKVWSVKSLTAQYAADSNPNLVESKLAHPPGDPEALIGTFKHQLPLGTLRNVHLIYAGQVYQVDDIPPGTDFRPQLNRDKAKAEWFREANLEGLSSIIAGDEFNGRFNFRNNVAPTDPGKLSYWGMLFHEASLLTTTPLNNASLRKIDQSWRVDKWNVNEVILIAKTNPENGLITNVFDKPESTSPTVLWLKGLPSESRSGELKPKPLAGKVRQETYIRIFIPVKPAAK
jgi:hypothetical protein